MFLFGGGGSGNEGSRRSGNEVGFGEDDDAGGVEGDAGLHAAGADGEDGLDDLARGAAADVDRGDGDRDEFAVVVVDEDGLAGLDRGGRNDVGEVVTAGGRAVNGNAAQLGVGLLGQICT
ncbi:hypothetical protein [Rhodococcus koreensis]|uniref:hypothetical protein n=1 Tax=Rhodococcus koreensis TaxID=99653 RepID=UPI0036D9C898